MAVTRFGHPYYHSSILTTVLLGVLLGSTNKSLASEVLQAGPSLMGRMQPTNTITKTDLSAAACRAFREQIGAMRGPKNDKVASDQVVVIRNQQTLFNWDDGVLNPDTAREMWSVSKSITATLIGAAIQDGKLKLEDPIDKYLPEIRGGRDVDTKNFHKVTVRDLLAMTSGIKWTENQNAPVDQQSDLPMLFADGYPNLVKYISHLKFSSTPGKEWNYSSVNAILEMAIIRKVYGSEANDMPWNALFRPLNIKSAHFEKDRDGTYVGAAYVHLSANDLAKIGELYLADGVWKGKRILPQGWVQDVTGKPVELSMGHGRDIKASFADGVYGQGGFWMNKSVNGFRKPFPHLPENILFASGLFGQKLIILPDQNLVIARTAHDDPEVDLPIDPIIGNALKCFAPESADTPHGPPLRLPVDNQGLRSPFKLADDINGLGHMTGNGSFSGMLAKELCSCHFISGLAIEECLNRSPIPAIAEHLLTDTNADELRKTVTVSPRMGSDPARARFNLHSPREGCTLEFGHAEHPKLAP